jgi:hypothetical protein
MPGPATRRAQDIDIKGNKRDTHHLGGHKGAAGVGDSGVAAVTGAEAEELKYLWSPFWAIR